MFDPYTVRLTHDLSYSLDLGAAKTPVTDVELNLRLTQWIEQITGIMSELQLCPDYRLSMATNAGQATGFVTVRFADPRMKNFFALGDSFPCADYGEPRDESGRPLAEHIHEGYDVTEAQEGQLRETYELFSQYSVIGPLHVNNYSFGPVKDRHSGSRLSDNQIEFFFTYPVTDTDPKTGKDKIINTQPTAEELADLTRYMNRLLSPLSTVHNFPKVASPRKGVITVAFHPTSLDAHSVKALYPRMEVRLPGNPKVFAAYCSHSRR